jgi:hypothetical protein
MMPPHEKFLSRLIRYITKAAPSLKVQLNQSKSAHFSETFFFICSDRLAQPLSHAYQHAARCCKEYNAALVSDPLQFEEAPHRYEDRGQCAPTGNLRDLAYVDLVPILEIADACERDVLLRRVVRLAIGAKPGFPRSISPRSIGTCQRFFGGQIPIRGSIRRSTTNAQLLPQLQ